MFRYGNYVKDSQDFSGNKMPGVAPLIHVTGVDVKSRIGAYLNITGTYTDHMPLNDANDEFATPFYLFGARLGYLLQLRKRNALELFAGVDNALDAKYSLGNDLNAAGRRYYNPAAPRNYYLGLRMEHLFSRPHE